MTTLTLQGVDAASQMPGIGRHGDCDPPIRSDAVYVLFTTIDATLAAARIGHDFATALSVPLKLVHVRTVPYPLSVDAPAGLSPLQTEAFLERLGAAGVDAEIRVVLCRDERRALPTAVPAHSLIVFADRRRWWPTRTGRWHRVLESAGYYVVFVDPRQTPTLRHRSLVPDRPHRRESSHA
jgi:hypothetical protein